MLGIIMLSAIMLSLNTLRAIMPISSLRNNRKKIVRNFVNATEITESRIIECD
jgi:hypothetical protein